MTPDTEKAILKSLSRIERELDAICIQVRSHGERITKIESSSFTPLPYKTSNTPSEMPQSAKHHRAYRWKQHAIATLIQLAFVAIFVLGGGLLLSRNERACSWEEIIGLTILGAIVAGIDAKSELKRWLNNGGGSGPSIVSACLVFICTQ